MPPIRKTRTSTRKKKLAANTPEPEDEVQVESSAAEEELGDIGIADEETRVQEAVADCLSSGLKPDSNPNLSLCASATAKGVSYATVMRRWKGIPSRLQAHGAQMSLSVAQEAVLVEWIKEVAHRGVPWTREVLRRKASKIAGKDVSDMWFYRFLRRHPDITLRWSVPLESCRAQALNKPTVKDFYQLLDDVIKKYNITPENMYNMDEKGVQMGLGEKVHTLVDRTRRVYIQKMTGTKSSPLCSNVYALMAPFYLPWPFSRARKTMLHGGKTIISMQGVWYN